MKNGKLLLTEEGKKWFFDCAPHVLMRLKAVFPRVDKGEFGGVRLGVTPETCVDVEWFCQRYPLEVSPEAAKAMRDGADGHRRTLASLELSLAERYVPRELDMALPPRKYQHTFVEVFMGGKALLLADELGLGKTVSAIAAFAAGALPALVVCPTHLAGQWQEFIRRFIPRASTHIIRQTKTYTVPMVDVVICTYSKIAKWGDMFAVPGRFTCVVFDEAQECRRAESMKWRTCRAIREACEYGLGLSATPIYNYGGEIFNVMECIAPGRLGSRAEFYREWCSFLGKDKWKLREPHVFGEYLRAEFLMLRRTRPEVGLELPKEQREVLTLPYDAEVLRKVEADITELARIVVNGKFEEQGQAAREMDARLRQATGVAKAVFVADFVRMLVENGEKVLLFGWHREVYDIWLKRLHDLNPVLFTGTESSKQKDESVSSFQLASKVMIMSLRSGAGVDGLQKFCSTCVFGELDWSPGVHEQCIGRLNRDGMKEGGSVMVYHLVADGGSDPVVSAVLGLKTAQARGVNDPSRPVDFEQAGDGSRVKQLARAWLARREVRSGECGVRSEERTPQLEVAHV